MKFGIVVFPGTSQEHAVHHVVSEVLGQSAVYLWHKDRDLQGCDVLVLPGGQAHGNYLRPGSLASLSPIVEEIVAFAGKGGPVLGIANGFQILLESGLLEGALLQNRDLRFICEQVNVKVESNATRFSAAYQAGEVLRLPIAHQNGNYFAAPETLSRLEGEGQVVLRYSSAEGEVADSANPNGSLGNIAGIANPAGNVVGLMPYPERASEALLGGEAGRGFFESVLKA